MWMQPIGEQDFEHCKISFSVLWQRSQALSLSLEESGSESPSPSPSVTSSQEARPKRPRSGVFGRTVSTVGQVVKVIS